MKIIYKIRMLGRLLISPFLIDNIVWLNERVFERRLTKNEKKYITKKCIEDFIIGDVE